MKINNLIRRWRHSGTLASPHGWVSRAFHWVGGALVVYGLTFTADFADLSNRSILVRESLFASALTILFAGRFIWMVARAGGSRLPHDAPRWEQWLSRAVHYGVYIAVLGAALTGLAIAYLARDATSQLSPRSVILDVHETFANGLIALIALHLGGAAWHWVVRRDGVWEAMVGHRSM